MTSEAERYRILPLATLDECRQVVALERHVWGYADAEDVVPVPVLIVSVRRGGILLGAFDAGGVLRGFVYSMAAIRDGRPTQWSHMLGVVPEARDAGLGARLKLAQRDRSLEMGLDLIEWTFDPLQALNAHFNFAKLGVVVEEYEVDIYGSSSSPLHRGSPTDRFVAQWRITAPHVARRVGSLGLPVVRDTAVAAARVVNPPRGSAPWLVPGVADLTSSDRRVLVEIPANILAMQADNPALALEWRLSTRDIFLAYLSRGYRVVDFFLATDRSRGQYLLASGQ